MKLITVYSAVLNSGPKLIREFGKNLERAGIKIGLIELRSCEFRGKLTPAGIKINESKENAQFSFRNVCQLGAGAAEKLARAGIEIGLIELQSVDFRQKLARPELK